MGGCVEGGGGESGGGGEVQGGGEGATALLFAVRFASPLHSCPLQLSALPVPTARFRCPLCQSALSRLCQSASQLFASDIRFSRSRLPASTVRFSSICIGCPLVWLVLRSCSLRATAHQHVGHEQAGGEGWKGRAQAHVFDLPQSFAISS